MPANIYDLLRARKARDDEVRERLKEALPRMFER
jgi:hypothetical protein